MAFVFFLPLQIQINYYQTKFYTTLTSLTSLFLIKPITLCWHQTPVKVLKRNPKRCIQRTREIVVERKFRKISPVRNQVHYMWNNWRYLGEFFSTTVALGVSSLKRNASDVETWSSPELPPPPSEADRRWNTKLAGTQGGRSREESLEWNSIGLREQWVSRSDRLGKVAIS